MANRSDSIATIWDEAHRVMMVFAPIDYLTKEELTHLLRLLGLAGQRYLYTLARDLAIAGKDLPPCMAAVGTMKALYDEVRARTEQGLPVFSTLKETKEGEERNGIG